MIRSLENDDENRDAFISLSARTVEALRCIAGYVEQLNDHIACLEAAYEMLKCIESVHHVESHVSFDGVVNSKQLVVESD